MGWPSRGAFKYYIIGQMTHLLEKSSMNIGGAGLVDQIYGKAGMMMRFDSQGSERGACRFRNFEAAHGESQDLAVGSRGAVKDVTRIDWEAVGWCISLVVLHAGQCQQDRTDRSVATRLHT